MDSKAEVDAEKATGVERQPLACSKGGPEPTAAYIGAAHREDASIAAL
jgi:hypothetical protein